MHSSEELSDLLLSICTPGTGTLYITVLFSSFFKYSFLTTYKSLLDNRAVDKDQGFLDGTD